MASYVVYNPPVKAWGKDIAGRTGIRFILVVHTVGVYIEGGTRLVFVFVVFTSPDTWMRNIWSTTKSRIFSAGSAAKIAEYF